jgi:hypothetical protein
MQQSVKSEPRGGISQRCGGRLLDGDSALRNHRRLLPEFGVRLPLLIGRALPSGDLVEGPPFRFHPDV